MISAAGFAARFLAANGIETVFGMLGHGNLALGEALRSSGSGLRFVPCRTEAGAGHAAAAYARFSGRPAAVLVSNGPAAASLAPALGEASASRLPVLVLAGEVPCGGRLPALQSLEAPARPASSCLEPFCRSWELVREPRRLPLALAAAWKAMSQPGLEGPAAVAIPYDIQGEPCPGRPGAVAVESGRMPSGKALERAAGALAGAERPLVVAGGGVIRARAWKELEAFCRKAAAPAVHTQSGNGALLSGDPFNLFGLGPQGSLCGNRAAEAADLVILAGTRLTDFSSGYGRIFSGKKRFVSLNLCRMDLGKAPGLAVEGDLAASLRGLTDRLGPSPAARQAWLGFAASWRSAWLARLSSAAGGKLLSQAALIAAAAEAAPQEASAVSSTGSLSGDLFKLWPCRAPGRNGYYVSFGFSSMGAELPAALGAFLSGRAPRPVVFAGDASFLFSPGELATLVRERVPAVIVVADNGGARSIERQQRGLGLEPFGNSLGSPGDMDLAGLARSLGAASFRVPGRAGLAAALKKAFAERSRPALVHAVLSGPEPGLFGGWPADISPVRRRARL